MSDGKGHGGTGGGIGGLGAAAGVRGQKVGELEAGIGGSLARACERYGPRVALVRGGEVRTYSELLERGMRVAHALRGAGLAPGTPVAAMLEDRIASMEVYAGAFFGGYPVIHVNDRLAAPEVAHILADSGARALFHTDGRSEVVDAADAASAVDLLVTIGADRPGGARGFEELVTTGRSDKKIVARADGDLAIVGYTSGTTGLPKGAMISQRALRDCVRLMPSMFRIASYGRCAFTGTLSFVSGIWGVILPHLYTGGTVTFLHPYTPESWASHIEADRSTFTYAPTPFIPAFAEQMRRRPGALRSVESVIHSGSPVPRAQVQDLVDVIGERYIEVWGMTEGVVPFTATTRADWRDPDRTGARDVFASAGRAFASASIRAVGPGDRLLGPGEEGELTVQADILFDGYLGDAVKTAASMGPHGFRTGDLGRVDEAGYVYVTGRATELIISGGMNVYPAEVEAALIAMPGVAECAVLGLPDERWGEAVTAVIVPAAGAVLTSKDVIAHVKTRIASYKRPQRVVFVAELPRNASMKVRKDVLRGSLGA
jgi:acyl-CoA synthetase (AMP-forming)/AMP-acid ligase II